MLKASCRETAPETLKTLGISNIGNEKKHGDPRASSPAQLQDISNSFMPPRKEDEDSYSTGYKTKDDLIQ